MKVIVVNKMYPYEGGWVLGVFSSIEKVNVAIEEDEAEDAKKKYVPKCVYEVEEWEVDGKMLNELRTP